MLGFKEIILCFFAIITSLVLAEALYRVWEYNVYDRVVAEYKDNLFFLDRTKPYMVRMRPDASRTNHVFPGSRALWSYHTNRVGFRGPATFKEKALRILILGDSYTFGWAVNDDEAYPGILEKYLTDSGVQASVLNAGVPGFSTIQEEALLKEIAPKAKPHVVILSYVMNDAEPQQRAPVPPWLKFKGHFLWSFQAFRNTSKALNYVEGFEPQSWKWRASRNALDGIRMYCEKEDIRLIIFILPGFQREFDASYPLKIIHQKVSEWGKEVHVPTFDLFPYFEGKNHLDYIVPGEGHPNARAHREFARIMAEKMQPFIIPTKVLRDERFTEEQGMTAASF